MKIRHLAIAAIALFLPLSVAACADSTGDLSQDEISKIFQDQGMPEAQADCIAEKVKSADLTEDELDEFNSSQDPDSKAGKVLMDAVLGCATAGS